jgi:S-adenosylmethionine:tRNA ribosyltransferase-isomerase
VKLSDFDFSLPEELIAQHPLARRDLSRMMVIRRSSGTWEHRIFRELPEILSPEHFLVMNNSRVFPARLKANRPGKRETIEVLLVRELEPGNWLALLRPAHKVPPGLEIQIGDLRAQVVEIADSGGRILRFAQKEHLMEHFDRFGEPPLPPYIHRAKGQDLREDRERYQTIYAKHTGSIAAPTAGLHFTPEILQKLEDRGIGRCEILLHVGYGTFQPVRCENVADHRMEPEYYEVDDQTSHSIRQLKEANRLLVAVGTTTTRVLEHLAGHPNAFDHGHTGFCNLFIYPGFQFRILDGLLTNFHLPRSSLYLLVCAFAGRDLMLACYREAISKRYRFFSYGDCMLIL